MDRSTVSEFWTETHTPERERRPFIAVKRRLLALLPKTSVLGQEVDFRHHLPLLRMVTGDTRDHKVRV